MEQKLEVIGDKVFLILFLFAIGCYVFIRTIEWGFNDD